MKFIKVFILTTILSFLLFPTNGMASTLEILPSSEKSNEWEIVIDKPKNNEVKSKPDVYNIYSMAIKYIGNEDIKIERVEMYRNDPSSSYDFELLTASGDDLELEVLEKNSDHPVISHQNFLISTEATNLKVIVTWKKEGKESRKYREEFNFKQ
ncbi:hypothetical protein NSQ77_06910 [Oceanobacillus sp. FSL K6-2867]|uniref:hypothetical protein n=1 Tax=Oceanobacillus sp. FSL K6-2867 TaxID=2954748 RepID=UPI0030DB957D